MSFLWHTNGVVLLLEPSPYTRSPHLSIRNRILTLLGFRVLAHAYRVGEILLVQAEGRLVVQGHFDVRGGFSCYLDLRVQIVDGVETLTDRHFVLWHLSFGCRRTIVPHLQSIVAQLI